MTQHISENCSAVEWRLVIMMVNTIPPRIPNDDDDEDEDNDTENDDEDEPPVVREPEEDEQARLLVRRLSCAYHVGKNGNAGLGGLKPI